MKQHHVLQTAKIGYIVISALLCLLGAALIVLPALSAVLIGRVLGIMLIVFGIVKLIGYFSKDIYQLVFQFDLALGILLMVLGSILLCRPGNVLHLLCVGIGIYTLTDGLLKIQIALDARRFGLERWWLILTAAIITDIFGLILVFRPDVGTEVITVLLGISMLFEGILNLVSVLTAVKVIRRSTAPKDVIEVSIKQQK